MKSAAIFAAAVGGVMAFALFIPGVQARGHGKFGGPPSTQPNQNKTVAQTVNQDQLADKETDGLKTQQEALDKAAAAYTGDAKLTQHELDSLEESLDSASFFIWSKGKDDDGKVTSAYGATVFPVDALTKLFEAKNITRPQAKILLASLKKLAAEKLKLNENLGVEVRTTLQKQFNEGLAKYYMIK